MDSLVIYGAGGHGKVVADAALTSGRFVLGFVDDSLERGTDVCFGLKVLSKGLQNFFRWYKAAAESNSYTNMPTVVVAIGDNKIRKDALLWLMGCGIEITTVIHPFSKVSESSSIGIGTVVLPGAVINPSCSIGRGVIINTSSSIDHDSVIEDYVHISPGAHLGGNVVIKEGTHISIGCSVRDKVCIGKESVVGVGSVVVKDVPERVVAYGCPAKIQKEL